jgi:tripartite-type tricarboxylate transporter receptor subunit TctC
LTKYNGQAFVIDNRPGAGGNLGAGLAARAQPDGYQLLFVPGSVLTMNPSLYAKLPFSAESFVPVFLVADMPILLVVHSSNSSKNLSEFVSTAKRDSSGRLFFSSPGAGSSLHLAIELFKRASGVTVQHVPYKSGSDAVTAILSREVSGMFANPPLVISHIKAGTLKALCIAGSTRTPQLPDVPSSAESGLAEFDMSSWFGLVAPAKTPQHVIMRLSEQLSRALQDRDIQQRFTEFGIRSVGSGPEEFGDYLKKDRDKWAGIIRTSNVRLE